MHTQAANILQSTMQSRKPSVAVVILNWNGKKYLERFLPFLLCYSYSNVSVIVVDNNSSDDSIELVQEQFPAVEIIKHISNEGFAKGYNTALKQINADYYVLLNSDVEVTTGWIEPVIELMETDNSIAACQPKILCDDDRKLFEYAGAAGGWIDTFGYPFARGRVFETLEQDNGQYDTAAPCFWASGAALFVRASAYHAVGGMDEYFFAHQEEIDLCWRLQLAGYTIFVQPASVVYHMGGGTLPAQNNFKVYLNFRNNLIMLAKNLPLTIALWKIPFRLLLDGLAAWKELFAGRGGAFAAIVKSHVHFVGWLCFHQHRSVFPPSKKGRLAGLYKGSVVWQYFINKRQRFSEIIESK